VYTGKVDIAMIIWNQTTSTRKRALRQENTALGTLLGAGVAAAVAGPAGVLAMGAAALAGGLVGRQIGKAIRIPKA